jgi:hypothetical protein
MGRAHVAITVEALILSGRTRSAAAKYIERKYPSIQLLATKKAKGQRAIMVATGCCRGVSASGLVHSPGCFFQHLASGWPDKAGLGRKLGAQWGLSQAVPMTAWRVVRTAASGKERAGVPTVFACLRYLLFCVRDRVERGANILFAQLGGISFCRPFCQGNIWATATPLAGPAGADTQVER